ncbi:MAG: hypothetical protein WCC10_07245, partial [Tumebacillaceae bacterium]
MQIWYKEYARQTVADRQRQIESINKMITIHNTRQKVPHPILMEARQIAPNQIFLQYDQRTDLASATNVLNYWIRSNIEHPIPAGITTEGMDYALTDFNSVRPDAAIIRHVDDSKRRFVMTFRLNAITGLMHHVLPCFVNLEGRTGYDDANWG